MELAEAEIRCVALLDRVRIDSWCSRRMPVPSIKGFATVRDIRLRRRDKPLAYARLREMRSKNSDTTIKWLYQRQKGWVRPWCITQTADDRTGITAPELWTFFKHCRFPKLLLFEFAFDFHPSSGVDADFVLQHALFGMTGPIFCTKWNVSVTPC
jgi:hypothetical protein